MVVTSDLCVFLRIILVNKCHPAKAHGKYMDNCQPKNTFSHVETTIYSCINLFDC